jgi:hypothetical protein
VRGLSQASCLNYRRSRLRGPSARAVPCARGNLARPNWPRTSRVVSWGSVAAALRRGPPTTGVSPSRSRSSYRGKQAPAALAHPGL